MQHKHTQFLIMCYFSYLALQFYPFERRIIRAPTVFPETLSQNCGENSHYYNNKLMIGIEKERWCMVLYMTLIIMWCQKVCNCRQYCFDLVRSQYSIHTFGTTGLYTRDYSEQLWFPLNEIHQPQLLRVN